MNAKRIFGLSKVFLLLLSAIGLVSSCSEPESSILKVGWQPPWANQGQIVAILKNTELLVDEGITVEFVPFSYGAPMAEAAVAGDLDIVFAGDHPVMLLLGRDDEWRAIAKMVNYRSAFIVPPDSPIQSLSDLSGKKIAAGIGSTTHRDAARILADESMLNDVEFLNLGVAEHAALIQRGGKEVWGEIDALATYDPTIALSVNNKSARIGHEWASFGLVAVSSNALQAKSEQVNSFMRAYKRAFLFYSENSAQADAWYGEESRLPLSEKDYRFISSIDPNLSASSLSEVKVAIDEDLYADLERNESVASSLGILPQRPNLPEQVIVNFAIE